MKTDKHLKSIDYTFIFPLIALFLLIGALSFKFFILPPMGKLLDPFSGAVQNEQRSETDLKSMVSSSLGLKKPVRIFLDGRNVPHIYADNTDDLYFAQGFVTAHFRLWQMDFLTYLSAGRMSEIFKDGFLDYDRNQRRVGIVESAKKSLALIYSDPKTINAIKAYTRGVNAYIKQLDYKKLPFEYKFFDYTPEPWTELKTVLVMKFMAYTLSGYDEDYNMSNLMMILGEKNFNLLYPQYSDHITPIINYSGTRLNQSLVYTRKPSYLNYSFMNAKSLVANKSGNPNFGSNSWAVSGKKTVSGYPILCNDPHLNLSLPSVWFETQLVAPGINVYGVAIPGTPAVIIGFNKDIAWGTTNGDDDVRDWYKLKIASDYKTYFYNNKWEKLGYRIETIKRREQKDFLDTVYNSIQGPIVNDKSFPGSNPAMINVALKWELHNASNEIRTFLDLATAKNYKDYHQAIQSFGCPLQNFTFACKDNTIAINHQGRLLDKTAGQGKFIMDGTDSSSLPAKYIPEDNLPYVINPSSNFVFSANQHPTNAFYKYYYNGSFREIRANRIFHLLSEESQFNAKRMMQIQLDDVNPFSVDAMKALVPLLDTNLLTAQQRRMAGELTKWNGSFSKDDPLAIFYQIWWKDIKQRTWDEFNQYAFNLRAPDDYVLLDLIRKDPTNKFFDQIGTPRIETAPDLVNAAFRYTFAQYDSLKNKGITTWGKRNKVYIMHPTRINDFSRLNIESSGHPDAINSIEETWGPSWRMIVELGERPKAFGIYPGGQSGNIGSKNYDDFVNDWSLGKYYELQYYISEKEAVKKTSHVVILH